MQGLWSKTTPIDFAHYIIKQECSQSDLLYLLALQHTCQPSPAYCSRTKYRVGLRAWEFHSYIFLRKKTIGNILIHAAIEQAPLPWVDIEVQVLWRANRRVCDAVRSSSSFEPQLQFAMVPPFSCVEFLRCVCLKNIVGKRVKNVEQRLEQEFRQMASLQSWCLHIIAWRNLENLQQWVKWSGIKD